MPRNLQYNDQGKKNSEILVGQNNLNTEEQNEIVKQGEIVYNNLKELFEKGIFDKEVEQRLSLVIEWYLLNYGCKTNDVNHDTIINDDLNESLFDPIVPRSEHLTDKELNEYVNNILDNDDDFDDSDEDIANLTDFSIGFEEINETNKNQKIKEYTDYPKIDYIRGVKFLKFQR